MMQINQYNPSQKTYPQSALQYLPYRIILVIIAVILIILTKNNLPQDSVKCIQDLIIDLISPITNFYSSNQPLGIILMTNLQLIADIQLIAFPIFWIYYGTNLRYVSNLVILGITKIIINFIFQTSQIQNHYNTSIIPSLLFAQNFSRTYFFSGITSFLIFNLLQLIKTNYFKLKQQLIFIQSVLIIYSIFILLTMRLNYFMDIITAIVFSLIVNIKIDFHHLTIDHYVMKFTNKIKNCCK